MKEKREDIMYEKQLADYFSAHEEEFLQDLSGLIAIPSVKGKPAPGCPFGTEPARALTQMLSIGEKYHLHSENWDNCIGMIQPSSGERVLDILAHLDVVPVSDDWTVTNPFEMKIEDGKVYGRGTADDKGPALAALYAIRAIKELGIPLTKGVRLVLGTDEESGSGDLPYYFAKTKPAEMTFSPDAYYPVINIEKGRLSGHIEGSINCSQIVSISAGDTFNIIPSSANAVLADLSPALLQKAAEEKGISAKLETLPNGAVSFTVNGVSAHAASPELANNPVTALLEILAKCTDSPQLKALHSLFPHGDFRGANLGIAMEDTESGKLSLSLTMLQLKDGLLTADFDCRAPLCAAAENLAAAEQAITASGFKYSQNFVPPHSVSADSDFVKTLLNCYTQYTGKEGKTIAIGGGTYAHGIPGAVAFGCAVDGVENNMHGSDEFAEIKTLMMSCNIFAQAILKLCANPAPIIPEKEIKGALLWLKEPQDPSDEALLSALSEEGISIIPVLVDRNEKTEINVDFARVQLDSVRQNPIYKDKPVALCGFGYGSLPAGILTSENPDLSSCVLISGLINPSTAYGTCQGVTLEKPLPKDFKMLDYLSDLARDSVAARCDMLQLPILLVHGFKDEIYGFEQAEQLFTSVKERQPESDITMLVFPEGGHFLGEDVNTKDAYVKEITQWFAEKMKGEHKDGK